MSSPPAELSPDRPTNATAPDLATLRARIDGLDDALHDLLMQRAAVVGAVAALGKVPFRPGREAAIVRRLLARHQGGLPSRAVARLWRELFAATTSMQGRFAITACEGPSDQLAGLAREHFGALTPLRVYRTPAQAIAEVSAGTATAAVLPMPVEEEQHHLAWWTALLHRDEPRIHVVARLPFWASPRPEGAVGAQALVVAASPPDPSGADRSLVGFELPAETSRARLSAALAAAGIGASQVLLRREKSGAAGYGLVDVDGHVTDGDPRLQALAGAVVLGSYAAPVEGA